MTRTTKAGRGSFLYSASRVEREGLPQTSCDAVQLASTSRKQVRGETLWDRVCNDLTMQDTIDLMDAQKVADGPNPDGLDISHRTQSR